MSPEAWAAVGVLGSAVVAGLATVGASLIHLMQLVRKENAEQHAASQAEMKLVAVGLARVEGAVNAHIASPHYAPNPTKEYA
jgi:hypothetical protein